MARLLKDMLFFFIVTGVPLIFWATYSGPFQWIAEAQLSMMGVYYVSITFILTFAIWIGFCAMILWIFSRATGKPIDWKSLSDSRDQVWNRMLRAAFLVAPIVLLAIAGYCQYLHETVTLAHINIAELVSGKPYPSRYLAIDDGQVNPELDHGLTEEKNSNNDTTTHYLPILPLNYKEGDPVHAFVEITERSHSEAAGNAMTTGLVAFTGMPGPVRVSFERDHFPPASHYVLLRFGTTPEDYKIDASMFAISAGICVLIAVFLFIRDFFRSRRSAR